MPKLLSQFELDRCPHCNIHMPRLVEQWKLRSGGDHSGRGGLHWVIYLCVTCGHLIMASGPAPNDEATDWYPKNDILDPAIPPEVVHYLQQAKDTLHAPDGSLMLSASAVDAMLKFKGYKRGSLSARIDKAAKKHMITEDMALWAHDVRLDANAPRHADQKTGPPTLEDAKRVLMFAETLAEILFVLPDRVTRGRQPVTPAPVDNPP
jgi:hypothetical protein